MGKYKLITLDMDGTLLNSNKQITEGTRVVIQQAAQEGKIIALSTGRGLAELRDYLDKIPEVRYLDCTSGAMIYDCHAKKMIAHRPIAVEDMRQILALAKERDLMVHFLSEESVVEKKKYEKMDEYQMGIYKPMFGRVARQCEDIYAFYEENPKPIEKCNLYHRSPEDREKTEQCLKEMNLSVMAVHSETASLELTAAGVNKGTGLMQLCKYLGISAEEAIAVGDADNDIDILKTAGLSVAMGNAAEHIKRLADVVVADCDHDGCAEAIVKYLL